MAKRVRVSDDAGTNWYTLPGNTGESTDEAGSLDDTIFGQDYSSSQTGLIGRTVNANGIVKGFAGYMATIKKMGTSTLMTAEPMSLVSGKTYQVTAATKRLFDRTNATLNVFDNAVNQNANVLSIDFLYGRVTFKPAYTVTGPVTITTNYIPLVAVGCSNEFTLTQQANANDVTCMDTAQANSGVRIFDYGLKTVSLELNGIYKSANGYKALLAARTETIIELSPDGGGLAAARGYFKPATTGQSGDVGDLEAETITFNLSVPDDSRLLYPFHWLFQASSTVNLGIQKCLAAWENKTQILVQYLSDGTNGFQASAVVTDISLAGGLESMNEYTMNFQLSDVTTAVP